MNYNITAGIRKGKADKRGRVPVYLFVYDGAKLLAKESLGHKIMPENWDSKTKKVLRSEPNHALVNSLIGSRISALEAKVIEERIVKGEANVRGIVQRARMKSTGFAEFARGMISRRDYAEDTLRMYEVYLTKIETFRPGLLLSDVNYEFLTSYESHLRRHHGNSPNTVWGNLKFINTITNDARRSGLLISDPFATYKRPKYRQTDRVYLTDEEVERIRTADVPGLEDTRAWFLFMCYTGLRFSDAIRYEPDPYAERITIRTKKTDKPTDLYVNDLIRPLLSVLQAYPLAISQVEYNRRLKSLGAACGLRKSLTSHVARHTFGAMLAGMGVSMEVAQGLLAHGSIASTRVYYHLRRASLDEAMKRFNERAGDGVRR